MKAGEALLPLLFNFASEYNLMKIQENHEGLELNGIYQLLFYTNDINLISERKNAVKRNT
jgi:hypothetical protein